MRDNTQSHDTSVRNVMIIALGSALLLLLVLADHLHVDNVEMMYFDRRFLSGQTLPRLCSLDTT